MGTRDEASALLDRAQSFGDPDQPMHSLAEVATAYEVPPHAARAAAKRLEVPMVGGTFAMVRSAALDLAEELDSDGWALGPEDDNEE